MARKFKDHLKKLAEERGSKPISVDRMQQLNKQFLEDMEPIIRDLRQKELESFQRASNTFLTRVFCVLDDQQTEINYHKNRTRVG